MTESTGIDIQKEHFQGKQRRMKIVLALLLVTYVAAAPDYDCSFGESYWCSNLSIAKKCGAVQHCMDTVWRNTDLSNMKENDVCQYCEQFIGDVRAQLNNQTEAQIEQFLNEACGLIPDQQLSDECKKQIDENVEQIFDMVRKALDPKSVCSTIGLCQGFKDLVQHHKVNNDLHFVPLEKSENKAPRKSNGDVCVDCKAFIGDLRDMIDSNATETQVIDNLKQMCHRMVLFTKNCDDFVEEFVPKYLDFMAEAVDPDTVCQAFGVCKGDKFILQKMRLQKMKIAQVEKLQGGELCPICQMAFQELKTLISEDTVQEDVENFIKKNLCSKLGSYQKTCEQDVDEYGALLFQLVTSEVDPTTICTALGLCGQKKSVQNVRESVECVMCEFIMKEVDGLIAENTTEAKIIAALDEVCSELPDTISQQCKDFVETYGKAVIALLQQSLDPQQVCTTLGLCQGSKIIVKPVKPIAPVASVGQGELCVVCETAIQYLDSLLEENSTQAEIEATLDKVCNFLPKNLQQECNDLVKQYGPMIIQLVLDAAKPEKVCAELNLCTSIRLPIIEPMITPQKAQLVGVNECTYGPSFWCQSYENAKKCKAVPHCRKYVWKNGFPKI